VGIDILIFRIVSFTLVICLTVALALFIIPTSSPLKRRLRWSAVTLAGVMSLFLGWAGSWPGPNTVTAIMIWSGLFLLGIGSIGLTRSICRSGK